MARQDMAKCSFIVSSMKSLYLFEERGKGKVKIALIVMMVVVDKIDIIRAAVFILVRLQGRKTAELLWHNPRLRLRLRLIPCHGYLFQTPNTVLSDFRENRTRDLQSIGRNHHCVRALGAMGKPDVDPSDPHHNN
jgi:hypothetical protein